MSICKAKKKPIIINFLEYTGDNTDAIRLFCGNAIEVEHDLSPLGDGLVFTHLRIKTLEGDMLISPGDFVIQGVRGEFYPCKPDIFHETYDIINE